MNTVKKQRNLKKGSLSAPEIFLVLLTLTLIGSLMTFGSFGAKAKTIDWSICKQHTKWVNCIIDGDTYLKDGIKYRIMGLDTPEKKPLAKCEFEHSLSKKATQFLFDQFRGSNVTEVSRGRDRYGRILVDTYVNGQLIAPVLIRNGLGVEYNARKRRQGIWCN